MAAIAPPTDTGIQYFSSPVRITTEAVELRDRSLSLEEIKSAEVVEVIPGKQPWEHWIGVIVALGLFSAVPYLARVEVWRFNLAQQALVELGIAVLAISAIAVLVWWLYTLASKNWRTFYVPRLHTDEGYVTLAAFEDEGRAIEMVTAIEEARARRASSTLHEPETLYHLDNTVHISDEGVAINSSPPIPAWRLRVSYRYKIEVKQTTGMKSTLAAAAGAGILVGLIAAVARPVTDVIVPYLGVLLACLIGIALLYSVIEGIKGKDRLQPLDTIYICRLRTIQDEFDALLTPDKRYMEAVIAAINSLVSKSDKRNTRAA